MRIIKGMMSVAAAALVFGGAAVANEGLASYSPAYETARMAPAGGGDAESLTSLRKRGAVKIGGDVELDLNIIRRTERGNKSDTFNVTEYNTSDMDLNIRVDMTADAFLFIKLDLDDFKTGGGNDGDLLEEVNFTWKNVNGSGWTTKIGKMKMPFGGYHDHLITDPYGKGGSRDSYLGRNFRNGGGVGNDHLDVSQAGWNIRPGEIKERFGAYAAYNHRDLVNVEMAVFQNESWDMNEDNSEDSMLFRSYALKASASPIENLNLQLSFANRHMDSRTEDDAYAVSFGFDYKMSAAPFKFYGEYIHGWDAGYVDDNSTDMVQLGVVWGVTEKIDLVLDGQWQELESSNIDEDFYKFSLGGVYNTDYGVQFIAEYVHEWYDSDNSWADAKADVLSFRTAYKF